MRDLTQRQREALHFIAVMSAHGVPPTLRELGLRLGISSTNAVSKLVDSVERKGFIARAPLLSRGISLTAAGAERARNCMFIGPGLCSCGATYFGPRCPACAGFQEKAS